MRKPRDVEIEFIDFGVSGLVLHVEVPKSPRCTTPVLPNAMCESTRAHEGLWVIGSPNLDTLRAPSAMSGRLLRTSMAATW